MKRYQKSRIRAKGDAKSPSEKKERPLPSPVPSPRPVLFFVAAVLICVTAWCAGRFWTGQKAETVQPPPPPAKPVASKPKSEMQAAVDALRQLPESIGKRQQILSFIDKLAPADFPQALESLLEDEAGTLALAERWAEEDPTGFFTHIKSLPDDTTRTFPLVKELYQKWAAKDPSAAFAAAKQNHFKPAFSNAAILAVEATMLQDVEKGAAMLAEFPFVPTGYSFPESLWKLDPATLIQAVLAKGVPVDKNLAGALREPMAAWALKSPRAVQEWLDRLSIESLRGLLPAAMPGLASDDPKAAAELVRKLPSAADREAASGELVRAWVLKDSVAAYQFAVQNLGAKRRYWMENMAMALIGQGSQVAEAAVAALPPGQIRTEAVTALAWRWLDEGPEDAAQWINRLPSDQSRTDMLNAISSRWAETTPESGRQFFLSNAAAPETSEAFRRFTAREAPYHPSECLDFVLKMPPQRMLEGTRIFFNALAMDYQLEEAAGLLSKLPASLQTEAVKSVILPCASGFTQVEAFSEWAAKLPPGPLRDTARELFQNTPGMEAENRTKALDALK